MQHDDRLIKRQALYNAFEEWADNRGIKYERIGRGLNIVKAMLFEMEEPLRPQLVTHWYVFNQHRYKDYRELERRSAREVCGLFLTDLMRGKVQIIDHGRIS